MPSGVGDGCARAFAPDTVPPGCPILGEGSCVWTLVSLDSSTATLTALALRIHKLKAHSHDCEGRLEQVLGQLLRMQADATPQGAAGAEPPAASAAALARDAWTGQLARVYA